MSVQDLINQHSYYEAYITSSNKFKRMFMRNQVESVKMLEKDINLFADLPPVCCLMGKHINHIYSFFRKIVI